MWAITDKFKHYLMGAKQCTIFTDNSAVACIENKKQLTALEVHIESSPISDKV